ncbi:MAG: hypothetical protein K6E16_12475 [Lachnospiraceae bacterium]|nr:hypothetical protein [Lachnospiraceae bacterium]
MICKNCGAVIPNWKYNCDSCGAPTDDCASSANDFDSYDDVKNGFADDDYDSFDYDRPTGTGLPNKPNRKIGLSQPAAAGKINAPLDSVAQIDRMRKKIIILYVILGVLSALLIAAVIVLILLLRSRDEYGDMMDTGEEYYEDTYTPEDEWPEEAADESAAGSLDLADYGTNVNTIFAEASDSVSAEANALLSDMDGTYESYVRNKDSLKAFYTSSLSASHDLYGKLEKQNEDAYRQIAQKIGDESFDINAEMDNVYNTWDFAMNGYYDTWDGLYNQLYEKCDRALTAKNTNSEAGAEDGTADDADEWNETYETYQQAWDAIYNAHQNAWSSMYDAHFAVLNGLLSGDTDVDRLITESKAASAQQMTEEPEMPEPEEKEPTEDPDAAAEESADGSTADGRRKPEQEAEDTYEEYLPEDSYTDEYDPTQDPNYYESEEPYYDSSDGYYDDNNNYEY